MFKQLWSTFVGGGITVVIIALCGVETNTVNSETIGFLGIIAFGFGVFLWRISKIRR
jgi:hypothetical protein